MVHREILEVIALDCGQLSSQVRKDAGSVSAWGERRQAVWSIMTCCCAWVSFTSVTESMPEAVMLHPGQGCSQRVPAQRALRGAQHSELHR